MNALAIDSAGPAMKVAAKNNLQTVTVELNIGPKQSQEILPAIDYVMEKASLTPDNLDYLTLCKGPGTFTGLRLAFSALKALELAFGKPVYGISTLECYAYPYKDFNGYVVSTIDAKKNQFFAAVYKNGKAIMAPKDTSIQEVASYFDFSKNEAVLCTGPDRQYFSSLLKQHFPDAQIICFSEEPSACSTLFTLAEKMIEENKAPLKDFEGPEYLRKSEAELNLLSAKEF